MSGEERYITDDLSDIETKELMVELPDYFSPTGDISKTAYLNWRFDFHRDTERNFFNMAKGYFETAIELIESCITDNHTKKADIWIFPIMFCVVHGIEVYLKGFNSLYRIHTKLQQDECQESKIEGKHDIRQLCQVAIKMLRDTANSELLDEMLFIQKFIEILYQNTDDMTFARYPITAKGKKHFYVEKTENVAIDLNVFRQWVLRVHKVLDGCTDFIEFQVEQIKEWQADMYSDYVGY